MSVELISPNEMPKLANLFSFNTPSQSTQIEIFDEKDFSDNEVDNINFDEYDLSDTKEQNKDNSRIIKSFTKQTSQDFEHEHAGLRSIYQKRLERIQKSLEELNKDKLTYPTAYQSLQNKEKQIMQEIKQIDEKFESYKEKNASVFNKNNQQKRGLEQILNKYDVTINMYVNSIVMYHMNDNKEMENKFLKMATSLKSEDNGIPFDEFIHRLKQKANQLQLSDFTNTLDEVINKIIQPEQESKKITKTKLKK